jgi:hypothetical protein
MCLNEPSRASFLAQANFVNLKNGSIELLLGPSLMFGQPNLPLVLMA